MLPVIWHPDALDDLQRIIAFIEAHNPAAARRLGRFIRDTAERMPAHLNMCR